MSVINRIKKFGGSKEKTFTGSLESFKDQPRFRPYVYNYDGFKIHLNDPLSFYYEIKYVFGDQIHYFETTKKRPYIIDGGAFIGDTILYFKKIYPDCEILAFEPDPDNLKYLYKNLEENSLDSIKVIEKGLYNRGGSLSFSEEADSSKITSSGKHKIGVTKLSSYIDKKVDYLKLNIEGAELQVCQDLDASGKFQLIDQLCLEWHSFAGEPQNLDEILRLLKNNGFKYYISGISGSPMGQFKIDKETQYYLMVYAKRIL